MTGIEIVGRIVTAGMIAIIITFIINYFRKRPKH